MSERTVLPMIDTPGLDNTQRSSLLRLRAAIDALLEKGFGDSRGREADDASTEVARRFGKLAVERARAMRLYDALHAVCVTCDGETHAGRAALRAARAELDHDRKVFR